MSLYQEQLEENELNWNNYRLLLHAIFQIPKKEKTREERLASMREYWQKKGKWTRKLKRSNKLTQIK